MLNPYGGLPWWKFAMYVEHLNRLNSAGGQAGESSALDEGSDNPWVDIMSSGASDRLGLTLIQGDRTG